jgi:hypothetical protein
MGQKAYLYKNSLWQESTRIPLAIRAPGVAKAGGQCRRPVSLIDLYPTLIDLCGLPSDTKKNEQGRPLDGHSLKSLLTAPESGTWTGPDAALTVLSKWKSYDPVQQSYTLRSRDWRYIRYENGKEELYRAAEDPHEWSNLAAKPEHTEHTEHTEQLEGFRAQLLAMIPKSNPAAQPVAELSAAEWKDTFFKTHPNADANGDGTLSWPEYKVYKAKLDAGEVAKPKGNLKGPVAAAGRLQTSGTFSKTSEGGIIFTNQSGGQVYYVIKELAGSVEPHLDKPVKIVANVKDSTKSKAKVMVYLVSIRAEETGKPQPKIEPKVPVAPERLQTTGTFNKTAEGGIIFTDQMGGQVYYAIKELASTVEPHLDKPVKIVAQVKDSTKGKVKVMVHLVSIQASR